MIFVDSNIVIDILGRDPKWSDWSQNILGAQTRPLAASMVVAAECASRFQHPGEMLDAFEVLNISLVGMDMEAAYLAGTRFRASRKKSAGRGRVLADFLIGAQPALQKAPLVTRDVRIYRAYFPELELISPETHP